MKAYTVAAIFQIGMATFDNTFIFMPLAEAQTFFNDEGQANVIEVYVADPDNMDAMRRAIEPAQQRPMIDPTAPAQPQLLRRARGRKQRDVCDPGPHHARRALNIVSGLIMLVQDKARAIAVLRTMGATRGAVMRIFLITGATIGVVGTGVGLALGLIVGHRCEPIRHFLAWATGENLFPARNSISCRSCPRGSRRPTSSRLSRSRSCCRSPRPSIRRGGGRGSIRWRRCAMNEAGWFPALALDGIERRYGRAETTVEVFERRVACALSGPVGGADRPLGGRKIDAPSCRGPA